MLLLLLGWEYNAPTKKDVLLTSVSSTHISSMWSLCKSKSDLILYIKFILTYIPTPVLMSFY